MTLLLHPPTPVLNNNQTLKKFYIQQIGILTILAMSILKFLTFWMGKSWDNKANFSRIKSAVISPMKAIPIQHSKYVLCIFGTVKTRFWNTFAAHRNFYNICKLDFEILFEQISQKICYFSILCRFWATISLANRVVFQNRVFTVLHRNQGPLSNCLSLTFQFGISYRWNNTRKNGFVTSRFPQQYKGSLRK